MMPYSMEDLWDLTDDVFLGVDPVIGRGPGPTETQARSGGLRFRCRGTKVTGLVTGGTDRFGHWGPVPCPSFGFFW